ncbi:hypothetical protein AM500_20025 [Bacillus sp. FJAT-18017]|jgi:predicted DNA-binding transcriptional regulator YafY|uniref:hypothetical protein n=1 Tax=unclassified Bacillus (in: firmicutes) TaxID=185979 RepID=UPI0005C6C968|nr:MULTISPECIES: hypothetical protein [unclassified Bacillus (in: firmicutes)]ALC91818.1 hypothetical protein AM500_20025 [Bacillus sp. FJAT-18017]
MNGMLLRSMKENMPLEVIYLSKKNELTQRKMIIRGVKGNDVYAFCLLRRKMRTFKLENILSAMPEKPRRVS